MNYTSWKRLTSYELGLHYDPNVVVYVNDSCDKLLIPLTSPLFEWLIDESDITAISNKSRTNVILSDELLLVRNMLSYYNSHHRS